MVTLITDGELLAPGDLGKGSVLLAGKEIVGIGNLELSAYRRAFPELNEVSAQDCYVCPGFVDPHEHLIGGSGENGYASKGIELTHPELVLSGITTAVGTLGADTTTRTMPALLAKVKSLREENFSAYLYTGGYPTPPATLTGSVKSDILFIEEIIGWGEVAIADRRSSSYDIGEVARLVHDAYVSGTLSKKAGLTHFHLGDADSGFRLITRLLDEYDVPAETVHATHITRNDKLLGEAAAITRRGVSVDMDTVDRDLGKSLKRYLELDGDPEKLTFSSDADSSTPFSLIEEVRDTVFNHKFSFASLLKHVTQNTARVLRLPQKGTLSVGADADVLIVGKADLDVRHVFTNGRHVVKDGKLNFTPEFLKYSDRKVELYGQKNR